MAPGSIASTQKAAYLQKQQEEPLKLLGGGGGGHLPTAMNDTRVKADPEALEHVTKAFLQMKKLDLDQLERAYRGE